MKKKIGKGFPFFSLSDIFSPNLAYEAFAEHVKTITDPKTIIPNLNL